VRQRPRPQFLQQWTPWCPEQVPDPVEHDNVLSPQTARGSPTLLPAQEAMDGNGSRHTG